MDNIINNNQGRKREIFVLRTDRVVLEIIVPEFFAGLNIGGLEATCAIARRILFICTIDRYMKRLVF